MSIKRDKSEIAESFRHLLLKADEMALDKKKEDLIERFNLEENDKNTSETNSNQSKISSKDRLGISNIKRIPKNPFILNKKIKSDEYLKHRKELIIKLSIILNKHIHYWLQKEMPKFSKLQLEKHIYSLLKHLKK
ncbi:MAG: hypothetical protein CM15mP20_1680 [Alphaproteobacteria bacterium]|nr:MAG: hypothetical protein CM15mP20_1680 [Alphaproteobacteria bacterium]